MKKAGLALCGILLAAVIAYWPVTTRVGVDLVVSSHRLTLIEKTVHFLSRHWQTRRIAQSIVNPKQDYEEKVERILAWVDGHIRPVPDGFLVVDDHPLHIILRGYGAVDQRTEVFTLLASYSGLPASTAFLKPEGKRETLVIALVHWKGNLYPVDVEHNILFKTPDGKPADLNALKEHPEWIEAASGNQIVRGLPYSDYWGRIGLIKPSFTRMELQKPWSRLRLLAGGSDETR